MTDPVVVSRLENGIGLIRVDRPERRNALNMNEKRRLAAGLSDVEAEPAVSVAIVDDERRRFEALVGAHDRREAMESFLDKRRPAFEGR